MLSAAAQRRSKRSDERAPTHEHAEEYVARDYYVMVYRTRVVLVVVYVRVV